MQAVGDTALQRLGQSQHGYRVHLLVVTYKEVCVFSEPLCHGAWLCNQLGII